MAVTIERGRKYAAGEAKGIVDQLYSLVRDRWETKVNQTQIGRASCRERV